MCAATFNSFGISPPRRSHRFTAIATCWCLGHGCTLFVDLQQDNRGTATLPQIPVIHVRLSTRAWIAKVDEGSRQEHPRHRYVGITLRQSAAIERGRSPIITPAPSIPGPGQPRSRSRPLTATLRPVATVTGSNPESQGDDGRSALHVAQRERGKGVYYMRQSPFSTRGKVIHGEREPTPPPVRTYTRLQKYRRESAASINSVRIR